jgi:DNA-binding CsgD family transcriptional regulator
MSLDERASALIKRIYCAGNDTEQWDGVAAELLQVVGGCGALTSVVDLGCREFNSYRMYGPDNSSFAQGVEEYAHKYPEDPTLLWASQNPTARFCDSSKTLPADEYLTNDFVRWNRARFGSTHWYVGYTPPDDQLSFSFSLHVPAEQGAGDPEAIKLFRMMFDHMECAVRVARRPFNPESTRSLVLLEPTGAVRQVSKGAELLFRGPGALQITGGQLTATSPPEQSKLDAAIARTASVLKDGKTASAVQIGHEHGRPWILVLRPLLSSYGPFGNVRCEVLVEIHPGIPRIGSLELLQSLFDLTGRELQVVRLLADGHSLESLAEWMRISAHTARTHLRTIFAKTSTSRQSELLKLCAGLSQP